MAEALVEYAQRAAEAAEKAGVQALSFKKPLASSGGTSAAEAEADECGLIERLCAIVSQMPELASQHRLEIDTKDEKAQLYAEAWQKM